MDFDEKRKPLTEIEIEIAEGWIKEKMIVDLEKAFTSIAKLELELEHIDTDPQNVRITRDTDMVALLTFDVVMEKGDEQIVKESVMRLCIPYLSIESVMERFTSENVREFSIEKEDSNQRVFLENHLESVKRDVEIELGKTNLSVKELLDLEIGDVIPLEQKTKLPLVGYITGKPKFSCLPGKSGSMQAVKIVGFAKKGGESFERRTKQ